MWFLRELDPKALFDRFEVAHLDELLPLLYIASHWYTLPPNECVLLIIFIYASENSIIIFIHAKYTVSQLLSEWIMMMITFTCETKLINSIFKLFCLCICIFNNKMLLFRSYIVVFITFSVYEWTVRTCAKSAVYLHFLENILLFIQVLSADSKRISICANNIKSKLQTFREWCKFCIK